MEILQLFETKEVKLLYMIPFFMWVYLTYYFPSLEHYSALVAVFILTSLFYLRLEKTVKRAVSTLKDRNTILVSIFADKFLFGLMILVVFNFFVTEAYFYYVGCTRIDLVGHYLFLIPLALFFFGVIYVVMSERPKNIWENVQRICADLRRKTP